MDHFNGYKPQITIQQFFTKGFGECKIIMCYEIIALVKQKHRDIQAKITKGEQAAKGHNPSKLSPGQETAKQEPYSLADHFAAKKTSMPKGHHPLRSRSNSEQRNSSSQLPNVRVVRHDMMPPQTMESPCFQNNGPAPDDMSANQFLNPFSAREDPDSNFFTLTNKNTL